MPNLTMSIIAAAKIATSSRMGLGLLLAVLLSPSKLALAEELAGPIFPVQALAPSEEALTPASAQASSVPFDFNGSVTLERLLAIKSQAGESKKIAAAQETEVLFDSHPNQLLIVGLKSDLRQIRQAIEKLDVPVNKILRDYEIRYGAVEPVEESLHQLLDASKDSEAFKSTVSIIDSSSKQVRPSTRKSKPC